MTDDGSSMYAGYYGVTISNDKGWTANQIVDVVGALQDMANAFSQTIGGTPMQAIQSAFNTYDKKILLTRDPDHKVTGGAYGWAWDSYTIHFRQFYGVSELDKRLICHEFGHIFDYNTFGEAGKNGEAGRILDNLQEN